MSHPSSDPRSSAPVRRSTRTWACAGCLAVIAIVLVLIGVAARVWLAPEDDSYHRSTDVTQTEAPGDDSAEASPAPEDAQDLSAFVTPSGNIACAFDGDSVGCSLEERDYPADVDCDDDLFSARVAEGEAQQACGEDYEDSDAPELGYGESAVSGSVACTSESDGLTCWDTTTGKGFTLSREQYETF